MMSSLWGERLAAVSFIAVALFMGNIATEFPAGGDMFPLFISASMLVIAGIMLAVTLVRPDWYRQELQLDLTWDVWKPQIMMVIAVVYVLATFRLGYFVSTVAFLLLTPWVVGLRKPVQIVLSAVLTTLFIFLLFRVGLKAQLPAGILF